MNSDIPQEILDEAAKVKNNLLPAKSRSQYEKEYFLFKEWMKIKKASTINEDVCLAYFSEKSLSLKSSSLWSKYSMLKSSLQAKDINMGTFKKLKTFLKRQSVGYEPKKSLILTREEIKKFMSDAPNELFLHVKVVILSGICDACRREEIYNMSVNDIQDKQDVLIVTIPDTKVNHKRVFTITNEMNGMNPLELYRKYIALRPKHFNHHRLFIYYKSNKCTIQRIGVHTIAKLPSQIAKNLKLPNNEQYTAHCFRRSTASMLADAGADISSIKRHGGWKSSTLAEGYFEDSIEKKKKCTNMILQSQSQEIVNDLNDMSPTGTSSEIFYSYFS